MKKKQKKLSKSDILSIIVSLFLLAAHITMIICFSKVMNYYSIYPTLFNYIVIALVCGFIIVDIIYFVGIKNKDVIQKSIVLLLAICITAGSCYGTVVMNKTNQLVDNVLENTSEEQYENISGLFVSYDTKFSSVKTLEDLKKFEGLRVGMLTESGTDSISFVGKEQLVNSNITYSENSYTNNTDLLFALIGGEIDVAIMPEMYRGVFSVSEDEVTGLSVDYSQYLDQMNEFGQFSKEIVVSSNSSKKDLSKDPFNVLLIGWSPVIGSTTVGLADAIIVATVNPQTYTVSMMSIARDSYVPITCYGGACDKINSGRSTSMDCFVSTVEGLIGEDIDFYMEINFAGFAELCGLLGGIPIDNPVSFELDGVYVPEGQYVADGWQALEFARERHHMPNGDFDRQKHQKEVIMQIAKKFLKHDLTFALDIFNDISDQLNTNMTFSQLSGVFNMLTSTKNFNNLSLFDMLDMHALRITGYADWHYNDDYELPLWIYRLYEGSVSESLDHMHEVMGKFARIEQQSLFEFNTDFPYERQPFYSTSYDEVEFHETLPPYYVNLTTMLYADALVWAQNNGAKLIPTFIDSSDERYDESLDGMIIYQSVAYGKKISKYPICNVTVMGNGKRNPKLPDFGDWGSEGIDRAKNWCEDNGFDYKTKVTYISKNDSDHANGEVFEMYYDEDNEVIIIKYYKTCGSNSKPKSDGSGCECESGYEEDGGGSCKMPITYIYKVNGSETKRVQGFEKPDWTAEEGYIGEWTSNEEKTVYTFDCKKCTSHDYSTTEKVVKPTCTEDGYTLVEKVCKKCHHTESEKTNIVKAIGHDWEQVKSKEATCTADGYIEYKCKNCKETKQEITQKALGHDWGEWETISEPTTEKEGKKQRKCNRCGETESETIPKLDDSD